MGSVNPLFVTERAPADRLEEIAKGFAGSMTQGTGQFCTKPGLAFVPAGDLGDRFCQAAAEAVGHTQRAPVLKRRLRDALADQVERTASLGGVRRLTGGEPDSAAPGFVYPATLMTCDAATFPCSRSADASSGVRR
jgi:NADP-dependent aldehyde dehydrogenase